MRKVWLLIFCLIGAGGGGAPLGAEQPAGSELLVAEQAKLTLKLATGYLRSISTRGGFVGIYSLDLKQRYGEAVYEKAGTQEIWVQPPGTPSVGEAFLKMYRVTHDKEYLSAARDVGRALAWGQRASGGWGHREDVSGLKEDSVKPVRKKGRGTFDDNITQGALSFLMSLDEVLDEEWLDEAVKLGFDFMRASQFENGAWPQWYPLRGKYHDYYTFNDRAINDCIRVMLRGHKLYGKKEYLDSAKRGGDFIILSQVSKEQAGWAQQYKHDMKPAWARSFEPPAVCSAVTAQNIRTLTDLYLYTKDEKYLGPVPEAIEWLNRSQIKKDVWARFYEVGTNKPIYGDRDSKIHYTLNEISTERRNGYSWQGGYGVTSTVAYYRKVKKPGVQAYPAQRNQPLNAAQRTAKIQSLEPTVKKIIRGIDAQGRWVRGGMVHIGDFVKNFNTLSSYLELVRGDDDAAG